MKGTDLRFHAFGMFACLFLLVVLATAARAAENVKLSLSEQDGYGRMVFTFPDGVPGYRASINAGILVLDFDKAVNADTDGFVRQMPRYIAMARRDEDKGTIRFALTTDFWLDTKQAENSLYVDLLPPDWTGKPPALPAEVLARINAAREKRRAAEEAELAAKAQGIQEPKEEKPTLDVRVASRAGMTRLVFDWNQPVLYSFVERQGLATITFDRTAKVDLSPLRVDPPPYLSHASAVEHDGRLAVVLTLKPGVSVNDFREDLSIVLDLKPTAGSVPPAAAETDTPAVPEPEAVQETRETPGTQGQHGPKNIVPDAVQTAEAGHDELPGDAKAEAAEPHIATNPLPQGTRPEGKAVVHLVPGRSGTDILVDWPEPVGAAVFERAGRLWIVFDAVLPLDIAEVTPEKLGPFGVPEVQSLENGTALVLPLRDKALIGAVEEGASWRISAGETLTTTGRPVSLSRSWREDGRGSVALDLKGTRKILKMRDKLVGDEIIVATARGPVQSVQTPRNFVEFQALQTAQGVAIVPVADDLNVAAAPDNVIVTRRDGLALSAHGADYEAPAAKGVSVAAVKAPAEMHFAEWREAPGDNFTERRQYYLARLANARTRELGELRFAYGRFLLGYGLAPEALAAFDGALEANRRFHIDPAFRAAKGVAGVLSGRYVEAIADLSANGLDNAPHAAAWRGLARAELGHWEVAREQFGLAGAILDAFDDDLRTRFRAKAAEAALKGGDIIAAETYAAGFPAAPGSAKAKAQILLVRAMMNDAQKGGEDALARYDVAIATNYPPVTARARFGKAKLLLKRGEISKEAFAKELESLRYAWRGDNLELEILTELAKFRLDRGEIGEALKQMRTASTNYPDSEEAHRMNVRMSSIFADYFLGEAVDKMEPVQALAFFDRFKELTPIGSKGDEMIRKLAERLVEVDLLTQAEQLLDYQVANRLHGGVAKAQVAARLAAIYLIDQKPENALAALRATKQNLLPEELATRRLMLEARALADSKQYDNALDLLSERKDALSAKLRADVLWDAGRWPEAGAATEALLGQSWKQDGTLNEETRLLVMRGAIAYSLAGDEEGLSRLRAKFGEAMSKSPDASAFAVVSEPIVEQGVAFREMTSRIASIDTLDRFLSSLKPDEVTALN
ncbi:hypothetical protein [Parvibaculum sp.]|uniref:hypothetical protein n=1 Tax=Parvibaculum sp. TaxID=2024848 RepID=UPI000C632A4F|nr:hypothetical protein [Parvibaculum sp.]MAM94092.1 hypothetical protein [Parvibaculum sp.]